MDIVNRNKTALIAITKKGSQKARHLQTALKESVLYLPQKFAEKTDLEAIPFQFPLRELLTKVFLQCRKIVLFTSLGAAVRLVAPLIKSKEEDPALVVVDQEGKFAISLLSGHWGGANDLAREVAAILGGVPVITTASELSGTLAADMTGKKFGWQIENKENIPFVSAAIVNGEKVGVYQDCGEKDWLPDSEKPPNLIFYDSLTSLQEADLEAALIITDRLLGEERDRLLRKALIYRPRCLVVGVGCRRWTGAEEIERALLKALEEKKLSIKSVRNLATIDIKRNENGLSLLAQKYGWPLEFFKVDELKKAMTFTPSGRVFRRIGALGVCEPAALISSGSSELLLKKTISGNVTVAIARVTSNLAGANREEPIGNSYSLIPAASPQDIKTGEPGKLYLVGLGPGSLAQMTYRARQALEDAEIVIGYKSYLDNIDSLFTGKRVISSGMGGEVKRAREAIDLARSGKRVALVSGGDTGIYGMAGLVFELLHKKGKEDKSFECEVVPGLPALAAVASLLGAPLMGDFAVVSLSDLLVPWETIARRLDRAAQGDFVLALYNPGSRGRKEQIGKAREIILRYRAVSTSVGIVWDAYRAGQRVTITDLEHMLDFEIDMNTLVIIGNSRTFIWGNRMVTPRGYSSKYNL